MPKLAYESKRFGAEALRDIVQANRILEEYAEQGYDLTLRQLFYQHVARGIIPNTEKSYKRLGKLVSDARMAGYIDWDYIVDRTRHLRSQAHWDDPADIIEATARSFKVDLWAEQNDYVECWIEKDALVGVIEGVCNELDIPHFSCRGYTSSSEMWTASQRLLARVVEGKNVTILHLGDHDPSGIDMTRDIGERLRLFVGSDYAREQIRQTADWDELSEVNQDVTVRQWVREALDRITINRIALNMDQVEEFDPPPNPAKLSDTRAANYITEYGDESWELDALDPPTLTGLIRGAAEDLIEGETWDAAIQREREGRKLLREASKKWEEVVKTLQGDEDD